VGKHGKSHHEYLQVMNKHQTNDKFRAISLEELGQHKTAESAWCALNGVVYDVTVYLNYHPGGEILLQGCGK
jgi:cytochrome b involved in lipid metabolism